MAEIGFDDLVPSGSDGSPTADTSRDAAPLSFRDLEPTYGDIAADVAKSAGIGLVKGAIGLAGLPGDAGELIGKGVNYLGSKLTGATPEESAKSAAEMAALNKLSRTRPPTSQDITHAVESVTGDFYKPETIPGHYAQTVGEFVPAAISPAGTVKSLVKNAVLPALASETAGQVTKGTALEPYARVAGAFTPMGVEVAAKAIGRGVSRVTAPFSESGRETLAGKIIQQRADDIDAVRKSLESNPEIVPGSRPTTFQQTGDLGLGSLEREAATREPAAFTARRAEQNQARLEELGAVQPTGDVTKVPDFLKSRLRDIDAAASRNVDDLTTTAREAADRLGGTGTPEAYGETIRNAVQPNLDAATSRAQEAVRQLGGHGAPETYGNSFRVALHDAETNARQQERALWNAVDPDNKLTVGMTPVQEAASSVYGDLSKSAQAGIGAEEHAVLDVIGQFGQVEPFRELTDLRSLVSGAMRSELSTAGRTPAYARLSRLRGAIEDSIDASVQNRLAQEATALKAGAIQPEETIASRLQAEAAEWRAARERATASAEANDGLREGAVSPVSGEEIPASRRPPDVARDQGVPPDSAINFDEGAAERLRAASDATRTRAQTFGAQPLKSIMRKEGQGGPYQMAEAAVPSRIFTSGPSGFQNVQRFLGAADSPEARAALTDYAISSMRRAAVGQDGLINPARFATWRRSYQEALRAFPELDERLANAARASEAVSAASPLGSVSNANLGARYFHPGASGAESVNELRGLMGREAADRVLSDYAAHNLRATAMTPEGVLDAAKLDRWRARHADALRAIPELDAKFADVGMASRALADATAARRAALDAAQIGAAGRLMGLSEHADVVKTIGGMFGKQDSVEQFKTLVRQLQHNPDAMAGLRKAVMDHMTQKLVSNTEAAASGMPLIKADQFQTFVKSNQAALKQVFSPEEISRMNAVAQDIQRANRSIAAVKLPGQSNTAQDLTALSQNPITQSVLTKILAALATEVATTAATGVPGIGLMAGVGGYGLAAARNAGMARVQDLVKNAMLDPELAKALLAKVKENKGAGRQAAAKITKLLTSSTTEERSGNRDEKRPAIMRAAGGRVDVRNINHAPTEAQKHAGNYAKDHVHVFGLPITIENAKGSIRRGVDSGGKAWECRLPAHYGYVKRTLGADGDHVDVYLGPHPKARHVFVIDQVDHKTKEFDEHKAMLGFGSEKQALTAYECAFSDGNGKARIGRVTTMSVKGFRDWLQHGDTRKAAGHAVIERVARA